MLYIIEYREVPVSAESGIFGSPIRLKESSGTSTIRSFFPETWLWDLVPIK